VVSSDHLKHEILCEPIYALVLCSRFMLFQVKLSSPVFCDLEVFYDLEAEPDQDETRIRAVRILLSSETSRPPAFHLAGCRN
jgi:hypothetical protein